MLGIYKIQNLVNNKVYIGSSKSLLRRKYEHFNLLKNNSHGNTHLQKAYIKYGKDAFVFYILEECSFEFLLNREEYWIKYYNSYNREFGYNLDLVENSSHIVANETKLLMKSSNKEKKIVYQYNLYGNLLNKFDSIKECSIYCNINRRYLQKLIRGKSLTYNSLYYTITNTFDYIYYNKCYNSMIKSVVQYTTDDVIVKSFISIKQASIELNVAYTNMSRHLTQNKPKTIRGYVFKYQTIESPIVLHN
jgi:hypothetical protein